MTDDLSTSLAAVLADHPVWERGPVRGTTQCTGCGQVSAGVTLPKDAHIAHVAEVLTARVSVLLTAAKHDAWNEAVEQIATAIEDEACGCVPDGDGVTCDRTVVDAARIARDHAPKGHRG